MGYGHDFHLAGFDLGFGLEFGLESGQQPAKASFGFAFENEGVGEEAVTRCVPGVAACGPGGVERCDAFSLVRDRTAGFGAVCARGGDAKF